jgi:hypothetical protein
MCIISTPTMLHFCTARFSVVRVSDKEILLARFCSTWRSARLRNIGERCKYSSAIQAFSADRKYLIITPFVHIVIVVATEELGKVCPRVQPIKCSCMVPPDTARELVAVIRAKVSAQGVDPDPPEQTCPNFKSRNYHDMCTNYLGSTKIRGFEFYFS